MAMKHIHGNMTVVDAASKRLDNVFANGVKVYFSFSAGKDSLCLASLIYDKIRAGTVNPKQLTVIFIDEEAIYDSMEAMALRWHKRFTDAGVEFRWYCLPLKQVSAFHQLQNDERWITWEPGKEEQWVRKPPPFAILRSPYVKYPGQMNFQSFCEKITKDGIQIIGVRVTESIQRAKYFSKLNLSRHGITGKNAIYPIYDWHDCDVWLYIKEHRLDYPDAYIDLYRAGTARNRLRLSNFFGADSCAGLRHIAATDPDLWARIEKREPNAYLAMMYWDSEMFKRSTHNRRALEGDTGKDYKELVRQMLFIEPGRHFSSASTRKVAGEYRRLYIKACCIMTQRDFRAMHDALIAGDPKLRSLRAIYVRIYKSYAVRSRTTEKHISGVGQNDTGGDR